MSTDGASRTIPVDGLGPAVPHATTGIRQLEISRRQGPDRTVLELDGELDLVSAPVLSEAVLGALQNTDTAVVLDLRAVNFIDSTGLKAVFSARNAVQERGRQFAVTQGSHQVEHLLHLTRLKAHLHTLVGPDDALA
jgi:anti-sigma B factor antagonist